MNLVLALTVGLLFGAGATLMLSRDLFRVVAGAILVTNATNLYLVAAGRAPRTGELDPLGAAPGMDPLVQAMTLTSIVITFGLTAILLALALRVQSTHGTIDLEELAEAERQEEEAIEAAVPEEVLEEELDDGLGEEQR